MCTKNFTDTKKFYGHEIADVDLLKIYFLKNSKKTCKPNNRDLNAIELWHDDSTVQMFPKDDHKHVYEDFEKDIQFKNNGYITKLPIRKTDGILPNNYILANNRWINLEKQLDRNKKRFANYDKIIQDYIKRETEVRIDY